MTPDELKEIRGEIESEMQAAVEFALESPMPDETELYSDVYVDYSNPVHGLR
jgi:pyruvate dehydrogenase E1 component alpha subunit